MELKNLKNKTVRVSSDDRDEKDKNKGNFSISLKDSTLSQNILLLRFQDALIPNNFYNIRSSATTPAPNTGYQNDTLRIQENGQSVVSVVVPFGQYLLSEYITALKTAIDAVLVGGNVCTITENATTKLLEFSFSLTATKIFSAREDTLSSNADVAGFFDSSAESKTITADSLPNLSGIGEVYVHCQQLNISGVMTGRLSGISQLFMVSFNQASFGSIAYKKFDDSHLSEINLKESSNISRMNIRLRDRFGNLLNPGTNSIVFNFQAFYTR